MEKVMSEEDSEQLELFRLPVFQARHEEGGRVIGRIGPTRLPHLEDMDDACEEFFDRLDEAHERIDDVQTHQEDLYARIEEGWHGLMKRERMFGKIFLVVSLGVVTHAVLALWSACC